MCMYEISKLIIFIFNFVIWAAGVALLGVGIYLAVGDGANDVVTISGVEFYSTGAYILLAAGAFMFIVGFCGCCGAMKESSCLLKLYFICLLALFVLEVALGIWALVAYGTVPDAVDVGMNEWEDNMKSGEADDASMDSFESVQRQLKCCGDNGTNPCEMWYEIYQANNTVNYTARLVSCGCDDTKDDNCITPPSAKCGTKPIYATGCNEAMTDFIQENMNIIAGLALAFGLAEVLGMLITCYVINEIGKK